MSELLSMKNITKRYGNGVLANEDAAFSLREGEIHAIASENGAGKPKLDAVSLTVRAGEILCLVGVDSSSRISWSRVSGRPPFPCSPAATCRRLSSPAS